MTAYLLTAAGAVFLTVIVGFIIPEGKLNKSINFILRIVCISILIQPVGIIFKIPDGNGEINVDETYIAGVYSKTQSELLESYIKKELDLDCSCNVEIAYENGQLVEKGVIVDFDNNNDNLIVKIEEYLSGLGYINITVNGKGD